MDNNPTSEPSADQPRRIGRRSVIAGATAAGAMTVVSRTPALAAEHSAARTTVTDAPTFSKDRPVLFRGATVITMDKHLGVLHNADVLVKKNKIRAVGHRLSAPDDAAVIEAHGAILIPGFVDTHRHMWQSTLRGVGADWTLTEYINWIYGWFKHYRAQDVYTGNYLGQVEAISDGVTTVMDWCHGAQTPEYADAAVDAHFDLPGRTRFGYGNLFTNDPSWVYGGDVDRMLNARFSSPDQLVTMQLALDAVNLVPNLATAFRYAKERNLAVSSHVGIFGVTGDDAIRFLADNAFLSPTSTLVHAATLSDDSYRRIADSGAHLSVSAESELNAGQGYPPTGAARRFGVPVSLSMDTVVWWSGDMFSAMRATLDADRGLAFLRAHEAGNGIERNELRAADVLRYATLGGAEALGMADLIGSITPGKLADLVLLRPDTPAMTPVSNPIGHVVFQAGRGDVDTVMVNGKVLKHRGVLLGHYLDRARRLAHESLAHLKSEIGDAEWDKAIGTAEY
ncbi:MULTISPECIES: amidohydrolase family protein [unclassified Streptomyces]|uniref:amidohydrolase family protein n=1 Tax=unclassified Streptomyces TaxID=2593676 RepID=UPI00224F65AE|nr:MULTISPECIES: amidohydrolase family protein [unclassified Streptomyces]MCX4406057.1 amidohydrolase family protein [Streptomyces sp. NBC_01764]MCX5189419.1 amidohydrolase family protein [Streptomyces sp. NBC_00268]